MGASDLLQRLRRAGLALTLTPDGGLHVAPRAALTDDHRAAIRAGRDALAMALRAEEVSPDTREAFEERAAIREFDGGQTRSEAERVAWCEVACRHYRRRPPDGLGCCAGGRDDLPAVYGEGNPLRHVPADLGESCPRFEWEPGGNYYGPAGRAAK